MIAPRVAESVVHSLLDNAPTALRREKETMMIKRVPILNRSGVHLGTHLRCINELASVRNRSFVGGLSNLLGSLTASRTFSARDDNSQIVAQSFLCFLQCATSHGCDTRGVPVK